MLTKSHWILGLVWLAVGVQFPARAQEVDTGSGAEASSPAPNTTILLTEDFDDPEVGILPKSSPNPARFTLGYEAGEYVIRKIDPEFTGLPRALTPGAYGDVVVAVDVRVEDANTDRWAYVACRDRAGQFGAYAAGLNPARGEAILGGWGTGQTPDWPIRKQMDVIRPGNSTNRLELTCSGTTIAAEVNGELVGSFADATFQRGPVFIAASGVPDPAGETRFDNLILAQPDPSVLPAPAVLGTITSPVAAVTPATGAVLLADNFDDPATGRLPTGPDRGYVDGEYRLARLSSDVVGVRVPGNYGDAAIAVDVRLVDPRVGQLVSLTCGQTPGFFQLDVEPDARQFRLGRWGGAEFTWLVDWRFSAAIMRGGSPNRIELSCAGSTISATMNGTLVAALRDNAYVGGSLNVGLIGPVKSFEARLDNLVVTQRDAAEPPLALPPPPRPGEVLLADNFDDPSLGWLPTSYPDPSEGFMAGYVHGQYEVWSSQPGSNLIPSVRVPGTHSDASLSVDATLVDASGRSTGVTIACRAQSAAGNEYRLRLEPNDTSFGIVRFKDRVQTNLTPTGPAGRSLSVYPGNSVNRIELTCTGTTISVRINGQVVASVQDGTHASGQFWLGAHAAVGGTARVRFDNLVVTAR